MRRSIFTKKVGLLTNALDDLIGYLSEWFDLMIDIEKEMVELLKINVEYPNFAEKCSEFKSLCEGIADLVDIAIDNLHFKYTKFYETITI